jgi:hypothetical protein
MPHIQRAATIVLLTTAFILSSSAYAQLALQEPSAAPHQTQQLALLRVMPGEQGPQESLGRQEVMEVMLAKSKPILGKPYSADSQTDVVQTLSDGNRIVRHTSGKFYRDSSGRTRHEQTFGDVSPSIPGETKIFLEDPTTNSFWVMDPGSKTSRHLTNMTYRKIERTEPEPHPTGPAMLPKLDESRAIVTQDLGQKTIEGVQCNGKRDTITIPAGQIGNEQPIVIVTETWLSSALEAVVQSSTNDPRFGQTTYQLHNIKLGEPARQLFDPPANFQVEGPK